MSDPTAFGAALRAVREDRGVSQYGLARQSGLSHGHISRLESGQRTPTSKTIERIAAALMLDQVGCERLKRLADIPPVWAINPHPLVERLAALFDASFPLRIHAETEAVVAPAIRQAERLARGGEML